MLPVKANSLDSVPCGMKAQDKAMNTQSLNSDHALAQEGKWSIQKV